LALALPPRSGLFRNPCRTGVRRRYAQSASTCVSRKSAPHGGGLASLALGLPPRWAQVVCAAGEHALYETTGSLLSGFFNPYAFSKPKKFDRIRPP
jgi:hypothetical protein